MESALAVLRARAEAGTSNRLSIQQYGWPAHVGGNPTDKTETTHEWDWEEAAELEGLQYKVQTFGGMTCIVVLHHATAQGSGPQDRARKALEAWPRLLRTRLAHAGTRETYLRRHFEPVVRARPSTLAAELTRLRNRLMHEFSGRGIGRMEDPVESTMFLSSLTRVVREKSERAAARYIYAHFYRLRMAEEYPLCDRILDDVDVEHQTPVTLVALLTITAPIKKHLENRASFYERARKVIENLRGPDAAARTLVGLE
jgi:hypothetical protein